MRSKTADTREGLFKSIILAYTVLILHIIILVALVLLVIFFGGLARHLLWIFLGGMVLVAGSAYLFYRRLRSEGRSLGEALRSPMFEGRAVEISFLGGMASLRLGPPNPQKALETGVRDEQLKLEGPEAAHIHDILALAQLLEKNLITPEEFAAAKSKILGG